MSVFIQRCNRCGHTHYPEALLCFSCGGRSFTQASVEGGRIHSSTDIAYQVGSDASEPTWLAVVEVETRTFIVARLREAAASGQHVKLALDEEVVWADPG